MNKIAIIIVAVFGLANAQVKVNSNGELITNKMFKIGLNQVSGSTNLVLYPTSPYNGACIVQSIRSEGAQWGDLLINPYGGHVGIGGNVLNFTSNVGSNKLASISAYNYGNNNGALHIDIARNNVLTHMFKIDHFGNSYLYGASNQHQTWLWSDKRLKTNIKTCNNALTKILTMRGVEFNPVDSMEVMEIVTINNSSDSSKTTSKNDDSTVKYIKVNKPYGINRENKDDIGFVAQELELVYPQLVKTDKNGLKAVNYVAIIPVLVEAIKEQQSQIENLKADVKKLKNKLPGARIDDSKQIDKEHNKEAILYQNTPNPTSGETQIKYYLSEINTSAFITINDMNGKQLKLFSITTKGESSVSLKANELQAGMYLYTLVVDGVVVNSKKMVIVE